MMVNMVSAKAVKVKQKTVYAEVAKAKLAIKECMMKSLRGSVTVKEGTLEDAIKKTIDERFYA